jgi:WD40 repeat protein
MSSHLHTKTVYKANTIIARINKCDSPVSCIEWIPTARGAEQLVFGSGKSLSFYDIKTQVVVRTKDLGYIPCSLRYSGGQLITAGAGGFTLELAQNQSAYDKGSWVWSACCDPSGYKLVTGTDEAIVVYDIDYDPQSAVELHTRLCQWDQARQIAKETSCCELSTITKREAEQALQNDSIDAALTVYTKNRDFLSAIKLLGTAQRNGWEDELIKLAEESNCETDLVCAAADLLNQAKSNGHLIELYRKSNSYTKLLEVHIDSQNWIEANKIIDEYEKEFDQPPDVLRAQIFVRQGHFEKAIDCYCRAERNGMAKKLLLELANSAAATENYSEASYHLWSY